MKYARKTIQYCVAATCLLSAGAYAADAYKPYVLASQEAGEVAAKVEAVKQSLQAAGFSIAGDYSPYSNAHVVIVTNDELKATAAKSEFGAYGAAQRVSVTKVGDQVQVAYTNPPYMANMYHMADNLDSTHAKLSQALGNQQEFGAKEAQTVKELRSYHYMFAMPYFSDHLELASYENHQAALNKVESGLTSGNGVGKIYRIDLPGKEESVFGVTVTKDDGADATVMKATDTGELRHTAHLPYEIIVSGNKAYMLHGKFRIAQSFPDLGMGTFMQISGAPDAIELAIKAAIK